MTGTFIQQKSYHGESSKPSVPVKRSVYGAPIADQSQNTAPDGPVIASVPRPGSKVSATHGPPIKRTILQNTAPGAPVPQIASGTGIRAKVFSTNATTTKISIAVNPGEIHAQKKVKLSVPVLSYQPNIEHTPGIEKRSIQNTASHRLDPPICQQRIIKLDPKLVKPEKKRPLPTGNPLYITPT